MAKILGLFRGSKKNTVDYTVTGAHYNVYCECGVRWDAYKILTEYGVTDACLQHAIKKLLRSGKSIKSTRRDVEEVISTLNRALELLPTE